MTYPATFDPRYFVFKAVLISFLCHTACLGLLIFSFPGHKDEQPLLVFLGSILRKYDLINVGLPPASVDNNIADEVMENIQTKLKASTGLLTASPANITLKSSFLGMPNYQQKKTFKKISEFLPPDQTTQISTGESKIEASLPPRQPLSLNPHDPH